ncbi:hypothetical protein CQW23_26919 [Capsicum baccatum]|uniref:Disease resistance N-terminal domain-containing protein n=1 Tax=Capsicum baccatum TaxID=33114 RepID=A0A2G2VQ65_CAPBA|nr:hypothetical protein CQW23_26919 [Capsicum baccatum]
MDMKVLAETLKKDLKKEIEIVPRKKEGGEKKEKGGGDNGGGGGKGNGKGREDNVEGKGKVKDEIDGGVGAGVGDSDKVGFITELEEDKLRAETRRKSDNDYVKIRNSMIDCQSKDDSINASKISMISEMEIGLAVGGAFLSSALNVIFDRISPHGDLLKMFQKHKHDDGLLEKLEDILLGLQIVLSDAENKKASNPLVRKWLNKLQRAMAALKAYWKKSIMRLLLIELY